MLTPDGRVESIPVQARRCALARASTASWRFSSRAAGAIWIGTFGGGANVLDPATRRVRQLPYGAAPGAVSAPIVTAIAEDARGNLWIGTDGGGLNLARADGTVLKVFRQRSARRLDSLPVEHGLCARGRRATGACGSPPTAAGSRASSIPPRHRTRSSFEVLSRADGLSSDTLYGIVPDAQRPPLAERQRRADALRSRDAAPSRPITASTACRARSSRSAPTSGCATGASRFGGPGGFNIFDPATLSENRAAAARRADERGSARRARRRRDAVLAARPDPARLSRQHRLARLRRARFHLAEAQPARVSHGRA